MELTAANTSNQLKFAARPSRRQIRQDKERVPEDLQPLLDPTSSTASPPAGGGRSVRPSSLPLKVRPRVGIFQLAPHRGPGAEERRDG
jgi:hypothetical protein